jgi:hypothetical protein
MEAHWYKARECYRVWIPARLSENGKRCRRFFATKAEAEKFILQTKRQGSVQLAELGVEEKHVLGVIRQSEKYEPTLLLEAWRRFEKEGTGENGNLTVQELAEKFVARQKAEGRSARTVIDDRWRLNAMTKAMGHLRVGAVKRADILRYMEGIAPGTNRRSHHKTLRKLWREVVEGSHCGSSATAREDLERGKDRAKTTGRAIAAAAFRRRRSLRGNGWAQWSVGQWVAIENSSIKQLSPTR